MKIEKEKKKKAFEVRFLPEGSKAVMDYVFARSWKQAKELANKVFASRKITNIKEVK